MENQRKKEEIKKFQVLEYNRISLSLVGMYTKNLHEPTNEFYNSFISYYVLFVVVSFAIISSAVYMYQNKSHFEIISESTLVAIAGVQEAGMLLAIGKNNVQVKTLLLKLQEIVDEGNFSNENVSIFE